MSWIVKLEDQRRLREPNPEPPPVMIAALSFSRMMRPPPCRAPTGSPRRGIRCKFRVESRAHRAHDRRMSDASNHVVGDLDGLLALFGPVSGLAAVKAIPRLDAHCRRFIALSPFLVISTADAKGRADLSPRGDPPGFVHVIDDKTILDRKSTRLNSSHRT